MAGLANISLFFQACVQHYIRLSCIICVFLVSLNDLLSDPFSGRLFESVIMNLCNAELEPW